MSLHIDELRVEPGKPAQLEQRDPADRLGLDGKDEAKKQLETLVERLSVLHNRLYAEGTRSVLLVVQGIDAAGKDGTIRSVMTGINPQGCRITSFKKPSTTELAHDYLLRVHNVCPARGEVGIFNRSHYEDVVTVGVLALAPPEVVKRRHRHINELERLLTDEGTTLVKVFLHVSREEQRVRLQERLDDPEKVWKFKLEDLDNRKKWPEYMAAYDKVMTETSTAWAPWHIVPADRNWVRNLAVAQLLVDALERLDPKLPAAAPGLEGLEVV